MTALAFNLSPTATRLRSQLAHKQAKPVNPGPSPVVPLAMLEEMTAAGATLEVIMIACRWAAKLCGIPSETPEARPARTTAGGAIDGGVGTRRADGAPAAQERATPRNCAAVDNLAKPAWKKRRETLEKLGLPSRWRGKLTDATAQLARNSASLSLVENININLEEREGAQSAQLRATCTPAGLTPLPEDFQPTDKTKAFLVEQLGDAAALVMTENFRDHYGSRPEKLDSASGWQSRLRKWARSEQRRRESPQRDLPLVRQVATGPPGGWRPGLPTHEEMLKKWSG